MKAPPFSKGRQVLKPGLSYVLRHAQPRLPD